MRILVTGDRNWQDYDRVHDVLLQIPFEKHTLIQGGAKGADMLAATAAKVLEWDVETFPAEWEFYGRAAGPMRNQKMIDSEPDICIAFHSNIATSRGTKNCVVKARNKNIPVWLVTPKEVLQVVKAHFTKGVFTKPVIWRDICHGLARLHS